MSTMMAIARDGRAVSIPIQQLAVSIVVPREADQSVHHRATDGLRERLARYSAIGWTVMDATLEMDDDFLMNVVRYTLTAKAYVGADAWTPVDRMVDEHTRGGWRREREAGQW